MNVYLKDIPLEQAQNRFMAALQENNLWDVLKSEQISLDEKAVGRVLTQAVWAKISSPNYHASAMDGFAVRSSDTIQAMPTLPVILTLPAQSQYVDTGDPS